MKEYATLCGFFLMMITGTAEAASRCAPRESVVDHLSGKFGESRQVIGLSGGEMVMELFASDDTGTWTITVTSPDGRMCIVAAGKSYEAVNEALRPTGMKI